jgi:aspartate aminotransferase-like enzyme
MLALAETLKIIREEGLENIWKKHIIFGRAVRAAIKTIGLNLFSPDDDSSSAVTAVWSPEGIDPKQITTMMRVEYGITIAGGQGKVKGKIFRIGHCGYFQRSDIISTIDALESVLERLGYKLEKGAGVLAAQKVFDSEGLY